MTRSAWCLYCNDAVDADEQGCKTCRCQRCRKQTGHGGMLLTLSHKGKDERVCVSCWRHS